MRPIVSDRLRLRPWQDEDADFLLDLESRWEVVRFLDPQPTIMNDRESALASIARRRAIDDPVYGIWAITTAADGQLVGNLLLKPIPLSAGEPTGTPTEVEIGWHLHPDSWGHGYATEAASAGLADAFNRGLTRVIAGHASGESCLPGRLSAARHGAPGPNNEVLRHAERTLRERDGEAPAGVRPDGVRLLWQGAEGGDQRSRLGESCHGSLVEARQV